MFKFVDRKESRALVLIGGWGFDDRIFERLELGFNYFFYVDGTGDNFETELKRLLVERHIEKVSLFGWSKGAFLACDFAGKNPSVVDELILASLAKEYDKRDVEEIKESLSKNSKAFLHRFYRNCFAPEEAEHYLWFKKNLLKDYLEKMKAEELIKGLDALSGYRIQPGSVDKVKCVKIVHGRDDAIAPVEQAIEVAKSIGQAKFIGFERTGHLPFLHHDFKRRLYE